MNANFARILVAGLVAVLAFAPAPTTAAAGDLRVSVSITSTLPTVSGIVTVTDEGGAAVAGALVAISNTVDGLPLPAASLNGATGTAGTFSFTFQTASTALVPGGHTVSVTATKGADSGSATTTYTSP